MSLVTTRGGRANGRGKRCRHGKTTPESPEPAPLLEKLWRDLGLTLVLVTHDSSVTRRAQRVGVMSKGRLSMRQDTRRGAAT
ncbi:MAG: hypothetical protein ACM3ML_10235 [Micromonosporaceae bacterium]